VLIHATNVLFVVFLIVGLPLWDRRETRRLRENPTSAVRIQSYHKTIGWLWLATLYLVLTNPLARLFTPALVEHELASFREGHDITVVSGALLFGLVVGQGIPLLLARFNPRIRQRLAAQVSSIGFFLPSSAPERRWFALVCISAGICEEIIYRGFLLQYFAAGPLAAGLVAGLIAAAVTFGIGHGYQGWMGMLATTVLAIGMSLLFLAVRSLWLPMLVHALIDLRILLIWPANGAPPVTDHAPKVG
jgi:uncharacterized protein